jgi:hypothetical protein
LRAANFFTPFNLLEAIMSLRTVASQFVKLCRQDKNFDVMRTMYAPHIVSVEGDGKETAGQEPVIKKSEDWVVDKTFHGETVAGPFFNSATPDQFTVYFTRHDYGGGTYFRQRACTPFLMSCTIKEASSWN